GFGVAAALALPFLAGSGRDYAKRLALACIGLVACAGVGNLIDHRLLNARPVHPEAQVVIFDIAGTSVRSGRNLFAEMPGWPGPPRGVSDPATSSFGTTGACPRRSQC